MHRATRAALLAGACAGLLGCRSDRVSLGFDPDARATYRYRYEIDATITRQVEGDPPRSTDVSISFESAQTVVEEASGGTRMEVTLTSEGSGPRTAVVVLDRAGSLQAIQQVDGLPVDAASLPGAEAILASTSIEPPARSLRVGDRWKIAEGTLTGESRLDRLGIVDGAEVAVVATELIEVLNDTVQSGGSEVVLDGDLELSTSTTFDLDDGSIRRSRTQSSGVVEVLVAAPLDVIAPAVEALVTYELDVHTTRIG